MAPATVIDVGAAIGSFSRQCHEIFPNAQYLLIEPLNEYVSCLDKTVKAIPRASYEIAVASSCDNPVTIKSIECAIVDKGWQEGWITPQVPAKRTGKTVAVVGSGPAGLACAQQLARAGHAVTLFERADRIGGLLRYGIPDFKMEKSHIDRRIEQMKAEGVIFRAGVLVGAMPAGSKVTNDAKETVSAEQLKAEFDAVLLTGGAEASRDLPVPGRELDGVHFAMEFLPQQNKVVAGDTVKGQIRAEGKHVVVIGGGDTGTDCVGTALRHGCKSVLQLEIVPKPPFERAADNPWPQWPHGSSACMVACLVQKAMGSSGGRNGWANVDIGG